MIETKAQVLPTLGFGYVIFALNYVNLTITVKGRTERVHSAHPQSTYAVHPPDLIDLEEMALLFNNDVPKVQIRLTRDLPDGTQRHYEGLIENLTLVSESGREDANFVLRFKCAWNPSVPALRGWN